MFKGILAAIGVFLLVFVLSISIWGFNVVTAPIRGRGEEHITINKGNYRIEQQNHFFSLCVSAQNAETAPDTQYQQLAQVTDEGQKFIINTNISALQTGRATAINQYNADARNEFTKAQFRAWNLPEQLDNSPYVVGSPKTKCAV